MSFEYWYTAIQAFDPADGDKWTNYIQFSKLNQLRRVVSLDSSLCPSVLSQLEDSDWDHNIQEDFRTHFFKDLDYLLDRTKGKDRCNVIAVVLNPEVDVADSQKEKRLHFVGYDLIDKAGGSSAITNLGGMEKAFSNSDLSTDGLIVSFDLAKQVRDALKQKYPAEFHADCDLWGIWLVDAA